MARVTPLPGSLHFNPIRASKISTTKSHRHSSVLPRVLIVNLPTKHHTHITPSPSPSSVSKDTCFSPGILCLSAVVHGILETYATSALRRVGMKRGYNSVILLFQHWVISTFFGYNIISRSAISKWIYIQILYPNLASDIYIISRSISILFS